MKKRNRTILSTALALTLACFPLTGCTDQSATNPQEDNAQVISLYESKLAHYESLIVDLQEQLLNEKEENYIAECEYRLTIARLESSINALSDKLGAISASTGPQENHFTDQSKEGSDITVNSPIELIKESKYTYEIQHGEVTVTGYVGNDPIATIPSVIESCPVTAIGEGAFRGCAVTSVTLPNSVQKIGWFAFADCAALSEIIIPASVKSIGYGAFDGCSPSLSVNCVKGSYAESYATSWGMAVKSN